MLRDDSLGVGIRAELMDFYFETFAKMNYYWPLKGNRKQPTVFFDNLVP